MNSELNKHTFSTIIFIYSGSFFLIFLKHFSSSSDESAIGLFISLFLTVIVYYMYEYKEKKLLIKLPLIISHLVLSLGVLTLINIFDFKIIVYLISIIGMQLYFIFYTKMQK